MCKMNYECLRHLEEIKLKIEQLANVALVIGEAMIHSPLSDGNFELSVSFLDDSLTEVAKELENLIEQGRVAGINDAEIGNPVRGAAYGQQMAFFSEHAQSGLRLEAMFVGNERLVQQASVPDIQDLDGAGVHRPLPKRGDEQITVHKTQYAGEPGFRLAPQLAPAGILIHHQHVCDLRCQKASVRR